MQQDTLKTGYFPLRIRITDNGGNPIPELLTRFLQQVSTTYHLQILEAPPQTSEALIAVPFPDKEKIRIDFNIFASDVEETMPPLSRYHFFMESAY